MIRWPLAILVLVVVVVVVVAIIMHTPPVRSGTIVKKSYYGASAYTSYIYIPNGNGTTTMIPQTNFVPEQWEVTVEGKNKNGDTGRTDWNVSKDCWYAVKIGDHFDAGK